MAEIIRLGIVYDTEQAETRIRALERKLDDLNARQGTTSTGAIRLAGAQSTVARTAGQTSGAYRTLSTQTLRVGGELAGLNSHLTRHIGIMSRIGGVGGPVALVAAAIGLAALAWKRFAEAGEDAAKRTEAALDRIRERVAKITDVSQAALGVRNQQAVVDRFQVALEARREEAAARFPGAGRSAVALRATVTEEAERQLNAAQDLLNKLQARLAELQRGTLSKASEIQTFYVDLQRADEQFAQAKRRAGEAAKVVPDSIAFAGKGDQSFGDKTPGAAPGGFSPELLIGAGSAILQGAAAGPGAFLGAAAGPVATINPLAGAIVGGVGGVFSLFDRSEERRHKELLRQIDRSLRPLAEVELAAIVATGGSASEARFSGRRATRLDAVERDVVRV